MEGRSDGQEAVDETLLALSERSTGLVQTSRRLNLAQAQVQTVQGNGCTRYDKVARTVDKRNGDMSICGQMFVRGINVGSRKDFEQMNKLIEVTGLGFEDVIDKTFPFEKAAEAIEYLWSGKHVGKIVVEVSGKH